MTIHFVIFESVHYVSSLMTPLS